jgi:hypothetical protein
VSGILLDSVAQQCRVIANPIVESMHHFWKDDNLGKANEGLLFYANVGICKLPWEYVL